MKKILLAFDGIHFSEGAFEFVRRLNLLEPVMVTGAFLPQVDYANLWSYAEAANTVAGTSYVPLVEDEESEIIQKNIDHFISLCQKNDIQYRVHKDVFDFALPELRKETRFADVLILSGELFYRGVMDGHQYDYLKQAVHNSECPVMIVPEQYAFPNNNILAYDGTAESVFAIKQFAYIFPELAKNSTLLVFAEELGKKFPSQEQITELVTRHYKDLSFYKLEMNARRYFSTWIRDREGALLISGSFSRSGVSELFKQSFVASIIKDHKVPVFIAHK